jgi:hypothetical protein
MQRRDFLQASLLSCFGTRLNHLFPLQSQAQSKQAEHSILDTEQTPDSSLDMMAKDFNDLADKLRT